MKFVLVFLLLMQLAGCSSDLAGPDRQECVVISTGELFRFQRPSVRVFGGSEIGFYDEAGQYRQVSTADETLYRCHEISMVGAPPPIIRDDPSFGRAALEEREKT